MSIIQVGHIKSTLQKRFTGLIDLAEVAGKLAEEQENYFLTRALAAFSIAELAKAGDEVAATAVVDGFKDNGIDGFHFDVEEHVCYLVQSKWIKSGNGSCDVGDILKFIQGVKDLLEFKLDRFGQKLTAKKATIESVLADSRATFVLVIVYSGQPGLSREVQLPLNSLLEELNDNDNLVSIRVLNQKPIHEIVSRQALGESVDLTVMLHEYGSIRIGRFTDSLRLLMLLHGRNMGIVSITKISEASKETRT